LSEYGTDLPKPYRPPVDQNSYGRYPYQQPPDDIDKDLNPSSARGPGVAAWNDFSRSADEARKALNSAARIEVPKRAFVVLVLVLYLGCLVPLNWCFFRAIGRVEWAWAAAPVIAIACTGVVIKLAQLDIGFVRSRNEIGVLEIHSGYDRAHLARYNALYTSLSAPYDFTFTDAGAAALPFPTVAKPELFSMVTGQERRSLRYVLGDEAMLQGVPVSSNSTTLMHSEEVFPLGGALALVKDPLGGYKLSNQTKLTLRGIGLLKKTPSGNLETAWINMLEPSAERNVDWVHESGAITGRRLWVESRESNPLTDSNAKPGDLNIRGLLNLAEKNEEMQPGEVKMIAWTDEELPGITISPTSAQSRHATMVLAHLAYADEPPPQPDANLPDNPQKIRVKAVGEP
jgi:hypothetical protein